MLGSSLWTWIGLLIILTGMWGFVVVIFNVLVFNKNFIKQTEDEKGYRYFS